MGNMSTAGRNNDELVDNLINDYFIETDLVSRIFRAVDRANYLLPHDRYRAYLDHACINGHIHLSSPCVYGKVLDALQLKPGISFLNIGSGTGYLSTMVGLALGTWGINHGVELHDDVIAYAYEKLAIFKETEALDEFEFAEPVFIQGNVYNFLRQSTQLYDRIYCGANCYDSVFLSVISAHLKIGGILVVPVIDQLHVVTNTTEGIKDKVILSVSFADLVGPDTEDKPHISEIPCVPISLQCVCRSVIRTQLRRNIDMEYPDVPMTLRQKQSISEVFKKVKSVKVKCMYEQDDERDEFAEESDSDWEDVEVEEEEMKVELNGDIDDVKGYVSAYRPYLSQKIQDLPLPHPLKEYLNYNRNFDV